MGINLGRVAVALARGSGAFNKSRYERDQQDFERERELAREEDARAYREGMLENQRTQTESLASQRAFQRTQSENQARVAAEMRRRRLDALRARGVDPAVAEALADDETGFRETMRPQAPRNIDPLSPEGIAARGQLARVEAQFRSQPGGSGEVGWQLRETADGLARVNVRTGQVEPLRDPSGQPVKSTARPGTVTQEERRNASLYEFAAPAAERALTRYSQGKSPSTRDRIGESMKGNWSPDWLGNIVQSDEGQQMYDDLTQIVLATQYALSGKAVTEGEARKLARGLMPQVGDKPGRAAAKIEEINARMRVLRSSAGRAMDPNAPEMEPTSVDEVNQKYRSTNPFAP